MSKKNEKVFTQVCAFFKCTGVRIKSLDFCFVLFFFHNLLIYYATVKTSILLSLKSQYKYVIQPQASEFKSVCGKHVLAAPVHQPPCVLPTGN